VAPEQHESPAEPGTPDAQRLALAQRIAELALADRLVVVAAESVTAGSIATALAAGESGTEWFAGSIVAYRTETKRHVLGVQAEHVITRECAEEMASGAIRITDADIAVAVTGVGGPDPEEGEPAGTVLICVRDLERVEHYRHRFDGDPASVVVQSTMAALEHLAAFLEAAVARD
jgi:PncC family amidohydrolase